MQREQLLHSIAATINDYRQGEIPAPDAAHVDRWVRQFDASVQVPILTEMDHVLKQSYLSRDYFRTFLLGLAGQRQLIPENWFWRGLRAVLATLIGPIASWPAANRAGAAHWQNVCLLEVQRHGASQREMVRLLQQVLRENHGLELSCQATATGPFLYLDDILFTGTRIIIDLEQWIQTAAPQRADIIVVVMASYTRGLWYTQRALLRAAAAARKVIHLYWFRSLELEDRYWAASARDGFHPTMLPEDPLVRSYAHELAQAGAFPQLRIPESGSNKLFSCEAGRHLLEQQFLLAGLKIRSFHHNPQPVLRPLGYDVRKDLGFGATVVTYRNCPNNCPLAWWWDTSAIRSARGQWYPLFPRKV